MNTNKCDFIHRMNKVILGSLICASPIQVIGTFADSSTISTTFTMDGVVDGSGGRIDFETFSLGTDWINLVSARIVNTDPNSNQGLFSVDNINIIPVPEPETYAMLLAGLGLLGFMIRGRKETVV